MDRRDALTLAGSLALSATLAGCATTGPTESADRGDGTEPTATDDETDSTLDNETDRTPDDDTLDLNEANVVDVATDESDARTKFTVWLRHDDAGEDGYADWWQVETLDGTRLGRRDLSHAHENEQPFDRSTTIEIPADVTCVVVRGHDETHGYGGRAVVVNLDAGEQTAIRQGSDRRSVSETDCP
jgi:predicted small lipoprotein YifL